MRPYNQPGQGWGVLDEAGDGKVPLSFGVYFGGDSKRIACRIMKRG